MGLNKTVSAILLILIFLIGLSATTVSAIYIPPGDASTTEPLWHVSGEAADITISDGGSLIAIATYNGILVYNNNGDLLWSWSEGVEGYYSSVDVSDNGNIVAASVRTYDEEETQYLILYWKNAKNLSGEPEPTWSSVDLYDEIEEEALATSSGGKSVLAVGTGPNVFYWNQSLANTGSDNTPTWYDY